MVQLSEKEIIKSLRNQPQLYPVIEGRKPDGTIVIIDGRLRKQANANWKEIIIDVTDDKEILKIKFNANFRRDNKTKERKEIVNELHEKFGMNSIEIAEYLGISDRYVRKLLHTDVEQSTTSEIKGTSLFGLSPSNVEWCDYEITIYRGCNHNCAYCYAKRMNERYHWIPQWDKPEPKEIHWTNLKNSINKHEKGRIFLGSASDSYQPLEEELQLTRKLLKDYLIPSKHHILILTKSNLIARDFDIIQGNRNVWVGMTITSLEKNPLEPNSPSPKDRLEALKEAHSLGIKTFISIEPWIPKITNPVNIIDESLRYVDFYIIGSLNYYGNELEKKETYISEIPEVLKILASNKKEFWIKEELLGLIGRNVHWNESLEHKKMWFNPKLIPLVLEGKKTTTIRGRKLCNVGDVLEIASRDYNGPTRLIKVLNIYSKKLGELTDEEIHRDGFSSLEELQEFWRKELKKVWDDNRTVYIHEFQLL